MSAPLSKTGPRKRPWLKAAAAGALLLGLSLLFFRSAVYQPHVAGPGAAPAAPPPVATAQEAEQERNETAVVTAAVGRVQRATGRGEFEPVAAGDRLRADDAIRTGRGGRADLRIGDKSELSVSEQSQVSIRELTRAVHRFKLDRGRLSVDYKADGLRVLRIENEASGSIAESFSARFSVLSTGATIAVATETGSVDLRAADQVVTIAAGRQALAQAGAPPTAPEEIPVRLLLKVADAARAPQQGLCARVEGVAQPGSQLFIDGVPAEVGPTGHFSVPVLRETPEKKAVLVALRDVTGREQQKTVPCAGETPESAIRDFSIRWRSKRGP
ncbi:MAG TPA: FecR family protein [Myxococcales bacterium]|nr:FecR family protein [Myxococcales bacterium]